MRNDARDDFDDVPTLRADAHDHDELASTAGARERTTVYSRNTPVIKVKGPSTGPLWTLICALLLAVAGLGWWSFQQISLMEQQLVATQESFARISEEAAGRLQAISGKVVAAEMGVRAPISLRVNPDVDAGTEGTQGLQEGVSQAGREQARDHRTQRPVTGVLRCVDAGVVDA